MSITDELRECIRTASRSYEDARNPYNDREILHIPEEELTAIADRIDAEYQKAIRELNNLADASVLLPVDADGVPIHVGDVMEGEKIGGGFGDPFEVVGYIMSNGEFEPMDEHKCPRKHVYLRHHQPDSWENIIADAANFALDTQHTAGRISLEPFVERCRRLAGEAE